MPSIFGQSDPGYKHAIENAVKKLTRFNPAKKTQDFIYAKDPVAELQRQINIGNITVFDPYTGSGAPSLSTVPNGGQLGDYYFRTDTPGTASQRIYTCTVAGTVTNGTATLGTWVALV
jgi:hypothetical protein